MQQLAELHTNGTSSPTASEIVAHYCCSESHCTNHQKHCFHVLSTHYPLSAKDILLWVGAMINGTATLEKPPSIVWEGLLARKSQNLDARRGQEGHKRAIGMSSNQGSHPSIVKVYVGKSSCKKCHSRVEESSSKSSTDSNHPQCHQEPDVVLQSSPIPHNDVHLHAYKSWYNSKYTYGKDIVTEEQWDQMEGLRLLIATIKGGLTAGDWEHLGIALGIGKILTRRAAVFEAKVIGGHWP